MRKILNIRSSSRGELSNSTQLGNAIVEKLIKQFPGSSVHVKDLAIEKYPHLQQSNLEAFFAPSPVDTDVYKEAIRYSEEGIREIQEADIIVISVALYNWSIPSTLKAWIDHIVRSQKTFAYKDGKLEGIFKNKKTYLAIASGGVYSDGPMKPYDFAEPYLKFVLGAIGLTDLTTFRAEGVNIPDLQESALKMGIEHINV
jgi:FMN-dependent NADH-azoreductase